MSGEKKDHETDQPSLTPPKSVPPKPGDLPGSQPKPSDPPPMNPQPAPATPNSPKAVHHFASLYAQHLRSDLSDWYR